jgi:hypothetical protein
MAAYQNEKRTLCLLKIRRPATVGEISLYLELLPDRSN